MWGIMQIDECDTWSQIGEEGVTVSCLVQTSQGEAVLSGDSDY